MFGSNERRIKLIKQSGPVCMYADYSQYGTPVSYDVVVIRESVSEGIHIFKFKSEDIHTFKFKADALAKFGKLAQLQERE